MVLALLVASSSGLLVDPFAREAPATNRIEEALDAAEDAESARRALTTVVKAGTHATPAQAWRALRAVAKHEPAVKAQIDDLVPALPLVQGSGHARTITSSFERALRELGAIPMNADPARRRGVLDVNLSIKPANDGAASSFGKAAWVLEASATLKSKTATSKASATVRTRVTGSDPARAAAEGEAACAAELARALVVEIARGVDAMGPTVVTSTPRIVDAAAALKKDAEDNRRARAILEAFPAQLVVEVAARGDTRPWTESVRQRFLDVSQDALPLTVADEDYKVKVSVMVREKAGSRALAGDALRTWQLRTTVTFTTADGRTLAEVTRHTETAGKSASAAAEAGAEQAARQAYDGLVDEVVARVDRLAKSRASR